MAACAYGSATNAAHTRLGVRVRAAVQREPGSVTIDSKFGRSALTHLPPSRHPDVAAYAVLGVVAVAVSPAVLQTRPLARVRRAEPPSRLHAVVHLLHLPHKAAIAARLYQQHLRQSVAWKL